MVNLKIAISKVYFEWMCDIIYGDHPREFDNIIQAMHSREFEWRIPNDNNRAFEGRNLRETFCEDQDIYYDPDHYLKEASLLEVCLALAVRCNNILSDTYENKSVGEWFWELVANAELNIPDSVWRKSNMDFVIETRMDNIVGRFYDRDGGGGFFPLKNAKKDQRKVELWYQMCAYLLENYY